MRQSELEDEPRHLAQPMLFFSGKMIIQTRFPDCDHAGMLRILLNEVALIPVQSPHSRGTVFNYLVLIGTSWVYSHRWEQKIRTLLCQRKNSLIGLKVNAGFDRRSNP